jgi:predicted Fe-Mo cluster-binding NifX family protein
MKIAVPTNDGLRMCPDFGQAGGYLVVNLELGEITQEEIRWNNLSDASLPSGGSIGSITDCQAVMADRITPEIVKSLSERHMEIISTHDPIITNAFVHYLEGDYRREANTCCCP